MKYDFLVDTDDTERLKVISVWSEFKDEDLAVRPRQGDPRGRSVHEQMVHQRVNEDLWSRNMLTCTVTAPRKGSRDGWGVCGRWTTPAWAGQSHGGSRTPAWCTSTCCWTDCRRRARWNRRPERALKVFIAEASRPNVGSR
jgi:hypothetical protein